MKIDSATRNENVNRTKVQGCTDFVLHKSQQSMLNGLQHKIIDYTEHKLLRYINTIKDVSQKMTLTAMVEDYKAGLIAIAWKSAKPLYFRVTKDSIK